jgi:hypothetical protein
MQHLNGDVIRKIGVFVIDQKSGFNSLLRLNKQFYEALCSIKYLVPIGYLELIEMLEENYNKGSGITRSGLGYPFIQHYTSGVKYHVDFNIVFETHWLNNEKKFSMGDTRHHMSRMFENPYYDKMPDICKKYAVELLNVMANGRLFCPPRNTWMYIMNRRNVVCDRDWIIKQIYDILSNYYDFATTSFYDIVNLMFNHRSGNVYNVNIFKKYLDSSRSFDEFKELVQENYKMVESVESVD